MSPDSSDAQAEIREEIDKLETRWSENPKGRVFAHLADAYRKLGEYSKAENLILHGLKNHPNYISAYIVLGRIYTDSERYSDAHAQFTKVLEIDPQNLIALKFLGDLAISGGRLEDARSWYERMLQVDPRNGEAQEALDALESGDSDALAALKGEAAPAAATAGSEAGPEDETEELAGTPDFQMPETSAEASMEGSGEPDAPASAEPGYEMPGQPQEPDAAAGEAPGQDDAAPWDLASELGVEEETGPVSETPVDGLMTHDRNERARHAQERPTQPSDDVAESEDAMPWDRILDPEDLEPGAPDAESAGQAASGPDDLNLDDMNDWTPGFLRDEDMGERQMDDDELFAGLDGGDVSFDLEATGEDSPDEGSGVVTETMAELYAEQGLFEDALRVYRQLLQARPDDEGLKAKIREIESKQARDASISAAEVDADQEPETAAMPEAAEAAPTGGASSEELPETPEVTPVSGLMSGSASELTAPTQDGEGEGEFEFELAAPADDLPEADPFAGSVDAGFLQEPPAASRDHAAPEQPAAAPEPDFEPQVSTAADEPESVPAPALASSPAPPRSEQPSAEPPSAEPPNMEMASAESGDQPVVVDQQGGERVETTIEDYLTGLLDYDPGAPARTAAAPAQASTAESSESGSEEGESADSDPEDMAQFQEWLRSLKR